MTIEKMRDKDGKLPAYVWPGGYPILYLDEDNSVLCPKCATELLNDIDEYGQFKPASYFVHYEGQPEICENCNAEIESAYGDPEENDNDN